MKAIMTLESGHKAIIDFLIPPLRKRFETQAEFESRITTEINSSQPNAVNKVVKLHILRHKATGGKYFVLSLRNFIFADRFLKEKKYDQS